MMHSIQLSARYHQSSTIIDINNVKFSKTNNILQLAPPFLNTQLALLLSGVSFE
jgi:hypothetical protein